MTTAPERRPLDFDTIDEVLAALRDSGHRVSAPARAVLTRLFEADGPVSVERLTDVPRGERLELTSVYRNLERFEQLGVVRHVHVGHGPGLYVLARGGDREYLVCEGCGRVTSVDPAQLDGVRETLRHAFGHEARFTHFPIHGRCERCQRG